MSEKSDTHKNFDTFNYFFSSLIVSCCFILALPKMSNNPSTLLFCYFFVAFSIVALFLNWYWGPSIDIATHQKKMFFYILPALLFIIISLIGSFLMISNNKTRIQYGFVTNYYYKFNLITIWLILLECYLFYNLYSMIKNKDTTNQKLQIYLIAIICFCFLSYFIIWSNAIGLAYFSADG